MQKAAWPASIQTNCYSYSYRHVGELPCLADLAFGRLGPAILFIAN